MHGPQSLPLHVAVPRARLRSLTVGKSRKLAKEQGTLRQGPLPWLNKLLLVAKVVSRRSNPPTNPPIGRRRKRLCVGVISPMAQHTRISLFIPRCWLHPGVLTALHGAWSLSGSERRARWFILWWMACVRSSGPAAGHLVAAWEGTGGLKQSMNARDVVMRREA